MENKKKFEKQVYIGNVYYTEYRDGKYDLNFNCIVSDNLSEKEKEIFDKLQEKIKLKLTLEVEEPILDEEERKYLSGVIRPFRNRVRSIAKYQSIDRECIFISLGSESIPMPFFKRGTMYKGMKRGKEYTPEELGL